MCDRTCLMPGRRANGALIAVIRTDPVIVRYIPLGIGVLYFPTSGGVTLFVRAGDSLINRLQAASIEEYSDKKVALFFQGNAVGTALIAAS